VDIKMKRLKIMKYFLAACFVFCLFFEKKMVFCFDLMGGFLD